jgi:hypothetical protein
MARLFADRKAFQMHRTPAQIDLDNGYDVVAFHGKPVIEMGQVSFPLVQPDEDLMRVHVEDLDWISYFNSSPLIDSVRVAYTAPTDGTSTGLYAVFAKFTNPALGDIDGAGETLSEALRSVDDTLRRNDVLLHEEAAA